MNKCFFVVSVLGLFVGLVNEAFAEIKNYKCGENCTATLDENGVFTISGSGAMTSFGYSCEIEGKTNACDSKGNIRPWENELNDIKTIKFAEDSEITSIGTKSFISAKNLTEAEFQDSLESIGYKGLKYAPLSTIILPDTLKSIGSEAFAGAGTLDSINIICMGNEVSYAKMKNTLFKYCNANCGTENAQIVDLSGKVSYANSEQCNSQKYYYGDNWCTRLPTQKSDCLTTQYYYWNGKKCSKFGADENINCASGFVEWENACLDEYPFAKKRWTPAEANEWLHDGNDNFVVITFKK